MTVFWPTQTTYGLDFPMDFLRPIASHRIRGAVVNDGQTPIFPSKNRLEEPALSQSAMQQAMQAMKMSLGTDETWRGTGCDDAAFSFY